MLANPYKHWLKSISIFRWMWQGEENKLMELEVNKNKAINEVEISYKVKISNVDANPLLNSEKGKIIGYKKKI